MTGGGPVSFTDIVVEMGRFVEFVMLMSAATIDFTSGGLEVDMEARVLVAFDS